MTYHMHNFRSEILTVITGSGKAIVDGAEKFIYCGDVLTINAGSKHLIEAVTDLEIIEIQLGDKIDVLDKRKFTLD